jgi:hypothetical protein
VAHGAARLSTVEIASYDVEARDNDGFVGDRARSGRSAMSSKAGASRCAKAKDPFGDAPISAISKQRFAALRD